MTTAARADEGLRSRAREIARRLELPLAIRRRESLDELMAARGARFAVVAAREGTFLYFEGKQYRYHPGMAVGRLRQVLRGGHDPLLKAADIRPGDRVVDATLGFGADAMLLSHAAGPGGRVVGVESRPVIAWLAEEGLRTYVHPAVPELSSAMRRVEVIQSDHLDFFRRLPDRSVDVIYFDPMFGRTVAQSRGIDALRVFGDASPLRPEAVEEAKRVARRRVVMKERRGSDAFARLGFVPVPKLSGRVQFGVMNLED
ncbi:MAG: class I SAM-dependent methyltransferase [Kyrpidia sp.]|nr:class I SAM-dependent methyltransferase [Kyrpidia sp.]